MVLVILTILFFALMLFSAAHDVWNRRIPNWTSIVISIAFLPAAYFAQLTLEQFGWHLLVGACAFGGGVALFYLGMWGGGDAKLVAASSLWMGVSGELAFLGAIAIAGGILSLPLIVVRRMKIDFKNTHLARVLDPKKVPYAVAICAGGFWAAPQSLILSQAITLMGFTQ